MSTSHTCRPGHPGILADDCVRCGELADDLLLLDETKSRKLWHKMLAVEKGTGRYETATEARAAAQLYRAAIWVERYTRFDPWRPMVMLERD